MKIFDLRIFIYVYSVWLLLIQAFYYREKISERNNTVLGKKKNKADRVSSKCLPEAIDLYKYIKMR